MNDPSTYLRSITVSVLGGLAKELWDAPVQTAALHWGS
jgi:hypothetical protein